MRNGSLPISFHRRLLRESLGAAGTGANGDHGANGGSGVSRAART